MNRSSILTWVIVIGLILFSGLAILTLPSITSSILGEGGIGDFSFSGPSLETNNVDLPYPGLLPAPTGHVSNIVFRDENGNGVQDTGEVGVPNVPVSLAVTRMNPDTELEETQTYEAVTDATGRYTISGFEWHPNEYMLTISDETLQSEPATLSCQEVGGTWGSGLRAINEKCQPRFSIPDILLVLGLTGILLGAIVGAGIPLAIIVPLLSKWVKGTKTSDEYAQGRKAIEGGQASFVKAMKKEKPPYPMPDHNRPGWDALSTTLIMGLFFAFIGAAYAVSFTQSHNISGFAYLFGGLGLLLGFLLFNRKRMTLISSEAQTAVDWGRIWVVLTGILIMGVGIGLMFFVRGS